MELTTKERLRKRIPAYLLLVAMVALVMHFWKKQPATVQVSYRLGKHAKGLRRLGVTYRRGTQVLAQARFSFETRAASAVVGHTVRLHPGDYDIDIELTHERAARASSRPAKSASRRARGGVHSSRVDRRTIRMRRPLLVRESGPVTVFIDDSV